MPDDRERPELVRDATHEAHLALCKNQRERVEYVCEVLAASGSLGSGAVLDWLELYGYLPRRDAQKSNVRTRVAKWRKAQVLDPASVPKPPSIQSLDPKVKPFLKTVVEAQQARLSELGEAALVDIVSDSVRLHMRRVIDKLMAEEAQHPLAAE